MKTLSLRLQFLGLMGAAALLGLSVSPLDAAVVLSDTAPDAGSLLMSSAAPAGRQNNILYGRSTTSDQYGGVAFELSGAAEIRSVTFFLGETLGDNASNAEVSFSLVKFAALPTATDTSYTYTTEHTEIMSLPALSSEKYITFSFEEPVSLAAGVYGVVLHFTTPNSRQSLTFRNTSAEGPQAVRFRTTDTWADGAITATTYSVSATESYFAVAGTAAVPEPSVAWLLGVGMLLGGRMAWKRRWAGRCDG